MEFAAHSDPYVRTALWAGAIAIALTFLLLIQLIWMRIALLHRERRKQAFYKSWRPMMASYLAGEDIRFPRLPPRHLPDFLHMWLHYHESLRGDSKAILNQIIHMLHIEPSLQQLLKKRDTSMRLIAMTALGHLQDRSQWDTLAELARSPEPGLSIIAARALVMIDPKLATDLILPLIVERRDWSPGKLAMILEESDTVFLEAFLAEVGRNAQQHRPQLPRLLQLVEAMHLNRPLPFVRDILQDSDNPELISACLRLVQDPRDLDLIRQRLDDAHWGIRVQVAAALGRLGSREDIPRLLALLAAPEWWVRYRAALALTSMPFLTAADLAEIRDSQTDRFAHDMLQQVMAEKAQI